MVLDVVYTGIEVARQGRDTACRDIDAEELVLIAVAHTSVGERIAHTAELLGEPIASTSSVPGMSLRYRSPNCFVKTVSIRPVAGV